MVWKSERWKSKLEIHDYDEALHPGELEIIYRDQHGDEQREIVYEDGDEQQPPRLLVSLSSVTSLKDLCEHEHAKYDKVVDMLQQCRWAYYKELRWLRDQLHLSYQTDEEAMLKKEKLTPDDFEVYWFQPPHYVDKDTQEFLLTCIRETNRKLIDENTKLREQIAKQNILDSGACRTVLRMLLKDNQAGVILRELHSLLKTRADATEFTEVATELLGCGTPCHQSPVESSSDPTLLQELETLRQKVKDDEAKLGELRAQLTDALDARLERERAEAERERADMVQQRADRLERQYDALKKELQEMASGSPHRERARSAQRERALRRSVSKLNEAIVALSPGSTPTVSPVGKRRSSRFEIEDEIPEPVGEATESDARFDDALFHLDVVASGFEAVSQGVLTELRDLRAKVKLYEASADKVHDSTPELDDSANDGLAAAKAEEALSRLRVLEAELLARNSESSREQEENAKLRIQLSEAQATIEELQMQLMRFQTKNQKLRETIKRLRSERGDVDVESDDDDIEEELLDFMIPYRKRAVGKPRWQSLHEDSICQQKRRDYLVQNKTHRAAPVHGADLTAAFQFLSVPSTREVDASIRSTLRSPPLGKRGSGAKASSTYVAVNIGVSAAATTQEEERPLIPSGSVRARVSMVAAGPSSQQLETGAKMAGAQPLSQPVDVISKRLLAAFGGDPGFSGSATAGKLEGAAPTAIRSHSVVHASASNARPSTSPAGPTEPSEQHKCSGASSVAMATSPPMQWSSPLGSAFAMDNLPSLLAGSSGAYASPSRPLRPARTLRCAAQAAVQSPALARSPTLSASPPSASRTTEAESRARTPLTQNGGLAAGTLQVPASSQKKRYSEGGLGGGEVWAGGGFGRPSGGVPLTNMGRGCTGLRQSKSATDVRGTTEFGDRPEGFLPAVSPALPPGRTLKGTSPACGLSAYAAGAR